MNAFPELVSLITSPALTTTDHFQYLLALLLLIWPSGSCLVSCKRLRFTTECTLRSAEVFSNSSANISNSSSTIKGRLSKCLSAIKIELAFPPVYGYWLKLTNWRVPRGCYYISQSDWFKNNICSQGRPKSVDPRARIILVDDQRSRPLPCRHTHVAIIIQYTRP